MRTCYGSPPPGMDLSQLSGLLIVVEGPDSAGRSTHVGLLARWLESEGFPVAEVGIARSHLVSRELERAKEGNVLSWRTRSLFYATDFYDQLENRIAPALRAGSIVLADRYIFTLMARDLVRGAEPEWLEALYSMAIVPDAVFYLAVSSQMLVERTLTARMRLDYWESGMDLGLSRDWFESFLRYQGRMRKQFARLRRRYSFEVINADRPLEDTHAALKRRVSRVLAIAYAEPQP